MPDNKALDTGITVLAVCLVMVSLGATARMPLNLALLQIVLVATFSFVLFYGMVEMHRWGRPVRAVWCAALLALWVADITFSPVAVYWVFILFFVVLRAFNNWRGLVLVAVGLAISIAIQIPTGLTLGGVLGPVLSAVVVVAINYAFTTIGRVSKEREQLIDELLSTQDKLVATERAAGVADPGWEVTANTLQPNTVLPDHFVNHSLGWKPWVEALAKEDFTAAHTDALIKPERIDSEYFRLLARDPAALKARTLTDLDIFYNTEGGLSRADRELAATVASRYNGCEYCASVHQARCVQEDGDRDIVDRLLDTGIDADLGSKEWDLIRRAAVALTETPFAFDAQLCTDLRNAGFDDQSILDLIYASSFFNWANRLMLTLGQPDVPKRFRQ